MHCVMLRMQVNKTSTCWHVNNSLGCLDDYAGCVTYKYFAINLVWYKRAIHLQCDGTTHTSSFWEYINTIIVQSIAVH